MSATTGRCTTSSSAKSPQGTIELSDHPLSPKQRELSMSAHALDTNVQDKNEDSDRGSITISGRVHSGVRLLRRFYVLEQGCVVMQHPQTRTPSHSTSHCAWPRFSRWGTAHDRKMGGIHTSGSPGLLGIAPRDTAKTMQKTKPNSLLDSSKALMFGPPRFLCMS
jgi:hypothetical protein